MEKQLESLHKKMTELLKSSRLPELSMTLESMGSLLKVYGENYIELKNIHEAYKAQSEEYILLLLEEIRVKTRQAENRSRSDDSSFLERDDLHRISHDQINSSGAFIEWSEIIKMLEGAFKSESSVKHGCEVLENLNYQIHFEMLKTQKQSVQFVEWLQIGHRFKDQELRDLYDFITVEGSGTDTDRDNNRVENNFPSLILLIKNEFLTMCEMQKGYIRSIEQLNHQVKQLISEITARDTSNYEEERSRTTKNNMGSNSKRGEEQFEKTNKHIQFMIHDYQRLKTQTQRLKQMLRSNSNSQQFDFLAVERQLARHINISNILQTQLNRVVREFNLYQDSFWQIYELPQIESLDNVVHHLMNINERTEHMTTKVGKIFKCHSQVKRSKNQLKIGCIMQQIQQLLKNQQPQLKGIQHVCIEVQNLTDGLLKDEGLGKGLLRVILGLDNLFSLLPIKDSNVLGMIQEQKQRLLRLVGGLAGGNRNQKSEDRTTITTEYQRQIQELRKQNQWLSVQNSKLSEQNSKFLQQNCNFREVLQQFKKLQSSGCEGQMVQSLQRRLKECKYQKCMLQEQLKEERQKFEREKNNLHIEVKKTGVKLERLQKLALRKMDINVEKPPLSKKGKVIINSHT